MLNIVILAAGQSTRMKSSKPKVLHEICGKSILQHVLDACDFNQSDAGSNKIERPRDVASISPTAISSKKIVVVGFEAEKIIQVFKDKCEFVTQNERLGSAHAVICCREALNPNNTTLVIAGDMPLITQDSLAKAFEKHNVENAAVTVLASRLDNPFGYGRLITDGENLFKIVEEKDANDDERKINLTNSGIYFFNTKFLVENINKIKNENAQNEYYLTDIIEIANSNGKKVTFYESNNSNEFLGVNDRSQLAQTTLICQKRINEKHMRNGVTLIDPCTVYIDADVEIGKDSIIYPNSFLLGKTKIGEGTTIRSSYVIDSVIGDNASVGPFAYIRPESNIGNNTRIGDFVEIKKSSIGDGSKVSHLTYVGDCDVGENVNFGCGSVVVNYDGKKKHRSKVLDNAFIGCNVNLISPVTIEEGAFLAAGSTITKDVPKGALAIARCRQENKQHRNVGPVSPMANSSQHDDKSKCNYAPILPSTKDNLKPIHLDSMPNN